MNPKSHDSDPGTLTDAVLELLALATGATDTAFWAPDPGGGHLIMQACPSQPVLAGQIRQDLASGLVSAAFQTATLVEDTGMFADKRRSDAVDAGQGQRTIAQIAAPVVLPEGCAGVVSIALILRDGKVPAHWGFKPDAAEMTRRAAAVLAADLFSRKVKRGLE